jgi:hypothetical protein
MQAGRAVAYRPREDYAHRAGMVAAYREAAGITDPEQAVSCEPHRDNPELKAMRDNAMNALEMVQEPARYLPVQGDLEARVLDGQRAMAAAPEDVSGRLRLSAQAEADARTQAADARMRQDASAAADADALADVMGAERGRLEEVHSAYQTWSDRTADARAR